MKRCAVVVLAGILAILSVAEARGQPPDETIVYRNLGNWFNISWVAATIDRQRFLFHARQLSSDFSRMIADKRLIANGVVSREIIDRLETNLHNSSDKVTNIGIALGQQEEGRRLSSDLGNAFAYKHSWLERLRSGNPILTRNVPNEASRSADALEEANNKLLILIGLVEGRR